jgi:hypothetical protein
MFNLLLALFAIGIRIYGGLFSQKRNVVPFDKFNMKCGDFMPINQI